MPEYPNHNLAEREDVGSLPDSEAEPSILTEGLFIPEDVSSLETKKFLDNIAEAYSALSMEDKDKVTRRIYGIEEMQEERTQEFMDAKLEEMEQVLQELLSGKNWSVRLGAIQMAEAQNAAYVHNPAFRLKFLRTEQWDAAKAAARFIRHFDHKLDLFGAECLGRDITFNDLTKEDIKALKKGYMQVLPVRDRAGRAIVVGFYNGQQYHDVRSLCRASVYIVSHFDQDVEDAGVVSITFQIKDLTLKEPSDYVETCSKLFRLGSDLPFRIDSWHTLLEEGARSEHDRVDRDLSLLDAKIMAASRAHYGKFGFWMNELMAFGIPHDQIPFTPSYKIKTKNHLEFLEMKKKMEEEVTKQSTEFSETPPTCLAESKAILIPTRRDVLFGKGKPTQFAIGNQRLALIVDGCLDQYHNKSTKQEKTALAAEVVRIAKAKRVRFLSKTSGVWREVDDTLARDKVSHMFRHQGASIKDQPNVNQQDLTSGLTAEPTVGVVRTTRPEPFLETSISHVDCQQLYEILGLDMANDLVAMNDNKRFKS